MSKRSFLTPALHRPERFQLECLTDGMIARRERREQVAVALMLGGLGALFMIGVLSLAGVL